MEDTEHAEVKHEAMNDDEQPSDPDFDGLEALANAAENPSDDVADGGTSTPNTVEDLPIQDDTPFMQDYKTWFKKHQQEDYRAPKFNKRDFSIERLWNVVMMYGGSQQVCREKAWAKIGRQFNPPKSMTNLSFHIKRLYERYLLAYEKEVSSNTAMPWQHSPYSKRFREENESSGESPSKRAFKGYTSEKWVHQSAVPLRGRQLIGRRIKLWIPQEKDYMQANVLSYNEQKDVYGLEYDDGFQEEVDLNLETWYLSSSEAEGLAVQQFQKLINMKGQSNARGGVPPPSTDNTTLHLPPTSLTNEEGTKQNPLFPTSQPLLDLPLGNLGDFGCDHAAPKLDFVGMNIGLEGGVVDNPLMQQQQVVPESSQLLMQTLLNWKDSDPSSQQRALLDFALKLNDALRKNDTLEVEIKGKDEQMLCIQADKVDLQQKIDKLQGEVQEVRRLLHSAEAGQSELRNCFQMLLSTVLASNQASNTSNNTTTSPLQHHNRQQMGGGSLLQGGGPPSTAPLIRALMSVVNPNFSNNIPKAPPVSSQQQQHSSQPMRKGLNQITVTQNTAPVVDDLPPTDTLKIEPSN